jgi:hypothetical protein
MLFVAEYTLDWEDVETAAAKRLEWGEVQPESFRMVGEYVWHNGEPPFRGMAIIEAASIEDLHSFVLHYGETLRMHLYPATDVMGGIAALEAVGATRAPRQKKRSNQ